MMFPIGNTREWFYHRLPKPAALNGGNFAARRPAIDRMLVLSKPGNPSYSYYLEERLADLSVPVEIRALDASLADVDPRGLFVLICRYIRPWQLLWLKRHHGALAGIGLFVDDDIASIVAGDDGPLDYRAYVYGMGVLPLSVLNGLLTHLWVSTEPLARTLARDGSRPAVLTPRPSHAQYQAGDGSAAGGGRLRVVFHTTGAHFPEHRFLLPVVRDALARYPNLVFEVVAGGAAARWWRRLAADPGRLHIRRPLAWPDYFSETSVRPADIALVPLLSGRTNDARSDTKRIDICRMQAAAIFSTGPIFERCAMPGEIFVENEPEAWVQEIGRLAGDPLRRQRAQAATLASMEIMRRASSPTFPGLPCSVGEGDRHDS